MELTLEDKCVADANLAANEKGEWSLYIRTEDEGAIISADELRWMVKQIERRELKRAPRRRIGKGRR